MASKVAEIRSQFSVEGKAGYVANLWDTLNNQRSGKVAEWQELRNYIFATDTSHTSAGELPWKNKTTLPKLCVIRDNLHSNYLSSLFPNDDWLTWQGYSTKDAVKNKASAIKGYMLNKCREGHFRTEMSKLIYDYIDYGNSFCTVSFETNYKELPDGTKIPGFIGPKPVRISPLDIVFNPLASSFTDSYKVIRSVKTLGELKKLAMTDPDQRYWERAIKSREDTLKLMGGISKSDFNKAMAFSVDGFGNLYDYYQSQYVEILEFYGDYHDQETGELELNKVITITDRSTVIREDDIPSWLGHAPIYHVGWRFRQDNLWAMGPLDNLVGLQYRVDHLENSRADAIDLILQPPLKARGDIEDFVWGPRAVIRLPEDGDINEVALSLNSIISADNQIQQLEDRMELYAGAPREAMGIRTPGEKTLGEVNQLANAAGRIFQEKITTFETELLEPTLNAMLEVSRRNMDVSDIIRVIDDDIGVETFMTISKSDITASGTLRPIGARHFGKKSQDLQNMISVMNSPIGNMIAPHTSGIAMTSFVDDILGLSGYNIFKENIAVSEQQQTAALQQTADRTNIEGAMLT